MVWLITNDVVVRKAVSLLIYMTRSFLLILNEIINAVKDLLVLNCETLSFKMVKLSSQFST